MSNLILRTLSALIIGLSFTISIIWFKPLFYAIMLLVVGCMLYEWYKITKSSILYLLLGLIIISAPAILLVLLRIEDKNQWILLLYFIIIWSVDMFAMIGGKILRGPKLAPYISPHKTWSGLIVGVAASCLMSVLFSMTLNFHMDNYYFLDKTHLIIVSIFLALIAQMSDLFISYFKRKFNIKDSGNTIPGHGGFLDRFDSIILTVPILFLIINIL